MEYPREPVIRAIALTHPLDVIEDEEVETVPEVPRHLQLHNQQNLELQEALVESNRNPSMFQEDRDETTGLANEMELQDFIREEVAREFAARHGEHYHGSALAHDAREDSHLAEAMAAGRFATEGHLRARALFPYAPFASGEFEDAQPSSKMLDEVEEIPGSTRMVMVTYVDENNDVCQAEVLKSFLRMLYANNESYQEWYDTVSKRPSSETIDMWDN